MECRLLSRRAWRQRFTPAARKIIRPQKTCPTKISEVELGRQPILKTPGFEYFGRGINFRVGRNHQRLVQKHARFPPVSQQLRYAAIRPGVFADWRPLIVSDTKLSAVFFVSWIHAIAGGTIQRSTVAQRLRAGFVSNLTIFDQTAGFSCEAASESVNELGCCSSLMHDSTGYRSGRRSSAQRCASRASCSWPIRRRTSARFM